MDRIWFSISGRIRIYPENRKTHIRLPDPDIRYRKNIRPDPDISGKRQYPVPDIRLPDFCRFFAVFLSFFGRFGPKKDQKKTKKRQKIGTGCRISGTGYPAPKKYSAGSGYSEKSKYTAGYIWLPDIRSTSSTHADQDNTFKVLFPVGG